MATTLKPTLKPGLTLDYQYFKNELNKLKFEPPTIVNQLKKLFIYLALFFFREKLENKDTMAAKNKLISSFEALNSIREDNLINLSKIKEIKLSLEEFLTKQKIEQDQLRKKLKIQKINSNENDMKDRSEAVANLLGKFDEITEKSFSEHESKLQKSYSILKMQAWGDESKEDFQNRLIDSVVDARIKAKNMSVADSVETNGIQADIDDAYKYLRDNATPRPKVGGACHNKQEEERSYNNFSPSVR